MAGNNSVTDSPVFKLDQAKTYKADGNACFKSGEFKKAISKYHRALLYIRGIEENQKKYLPGQEDIAPLKEEMAEEVKNLKRDCHNNLANCLLQGEAPDYSKIVQYCDHVLADFPSSVKALYRKGLSLYNMKNYDEAVTVLKKAQSLPDGQRDGKIIKHIQLCEQALKKQDSSMKSAYKKMIHNMSAE